MDFWNTSIPFLVLLAPVAGMAYLALRGRGSPEAEFKLGMFTWGLVFMAALAGIVRFDSTVLLQSYWPFSADPSGYFEFAIHQRWNRYVWVLFVSAILFCYAFYERFSVTKAGTTAYLFGASLFISMGFLSENVLLTLLFIEITFFLFYAFSAQSGDAESNLGRSAYFKRATFIVLSLLALIGVSATNAFSPSSIFLLGAVLYTLAFIFSRHGFTQWSQLYLCLIQAGAMYFLLASVVKEDMPADLWMPISLLFGAFAAGFALFSLMSFSAISSAFWLLFTVFGFTLFLRFSSGKPEELFWGFFEAVALAAILAVALMFRSGGAAKQAWERGLYILVTFILLAVIATAIPGADVAGPRATVELPVRMIGIGALTFLLSLTVGKGMAVSFHSVAPAKSKDTFVTGIVPSLLLLLLQVGVILKVTDLQGESPFRMGLAYLITSPHVIVTSSAVLSGLLAGLLLGFNSAFLKWLRNREKKMEDLFPLVTPSIVKWNAAVGSIPEKGILWVSGKLKAASDRLGSMIFAFDSSILGEKVYRGFREYTASVSYLIRYFHSGNVRAYLIMGVAATIFASVMFLLEGR